MKSPFVDLRAQYESIREAVNTAVSATLERGDFILEEAVARFEREFARYCGVKHALGVSSGTDAIRLALEDRDVEQVYHLHVVTVDRRDELRRHLAQQGIETGIHYPIPIHHQEVCKTLGRRGEYPVVEQHAGTILSPPFVAELSEEQGKRVVGAIAQFQTIGVA